MKEAIRVILAAAVCGLFTTVNPAFAQGTAFTYQGQLQNNGSQASGTYNLTFSLYTNNTGGTAVAGPVTTNGVIITNGLFTVTMDFGSGVWNGATNWLQIGVETNGAGSFSTLAPRQELTPVPYGIYAESAGSLLGLVVQPNLDGAPNLIGGSSVNFVLSGVVGATIGGGGATSYFGYSILSNSVTAVFGTVGGGIGNTASGGNATVGGGTGNTASGGDATIAGGDGNNAGGSATVGGGDFNNASGQRATIGGGEDNIASGSGAYVGGGGFDGTILEGNQASGNAVVVSGGLGNTASGNYAAVGGGENNTNLSSLAIIGGGYENVIQSGNAAVIGGGYQNLIELDSYEATVAGGALNVIGTNANQTSISGGYGNTNAAPQSFIGSGYENMIQAGNAAVIGGGYQNLIQSNSYEATIAGGWANNVDLNSEQATIGGGYDNVIQSDGLDCTIGGGGGNAIYVGNSASDIAGGSGNTIYADNDNSFIGGGYQNLIAPEASFSVIGGGEANGIYLDGATYSTIGGGNDNYALDSYAFIGGGEGNFIEPGGTFAAIPGGYNNSATGTDSFAAGQNANANDNGSFVWSDGATVSSFGQNTFTAHASGGFQFQLASSTVAISASGTLSVPVLTITGGSDVAEPFQMSSAAIPKGSVVIIDEEHPGRLKVSDRPYDTRVAGIVSGANGVNPGISLHQVNALNGDQNVALSGRVYVLADTSTGSILPGDLLTTSVTPGHAMKVTDHVRAQGAILGKAMTGLSDGQGMVLVLVTLQ